MGLLFRLWLHLASNNWFQYTRSKIKLVQHRSKINKSYHSIVKNRPRDIIFFDFLILFVLIVSHIYITWYCTQNTCHVSESKLKLETCSDKLYFNVIFFTLSCFSKALPIWELIFSEDTFNQLLSWVLNIFWTIWGSTFSRTCGITFINLPKFQSFTFKPTGIVIIMDDFNLLYFGCKILPIRT